MTAIWLVGASKRYGGQLEESTGRRSRFGGAANQPGSPFFPVVILTVSLQAAVWLGRRGLNFRGSDLASPALAQETRQPAFPEDRLPGISMSPRQCRKYYR